MEYLKSDCERLVGKLCQFCETNHRRFSLLQSRIPRPVPDYSNPGHYLNVFDTSVYDENGVLRIPDNWQPRANIKKMFAEGKMNSEKEISEFSAKFMVDEILVEKYVKHLQQLQRLKAMQTVQRQTE